MVNLQTEVIEGLLRLNHPDQGVLPPLEYIRAAEQIGLILEIGDQVIDLGLEALERIQAYPRFSGAYVGINFSAAQFLPSLPTKLAARIMQRSIDPKYLVLEITETVLMQHNPGLDHIFRSIREFGCSFALDDFGTGFSSLSYINRFPVDTVKIDRSFVSGLVEKSSPERESKTIALIEGIVSISHKLNLKVIAEGIETAEQLRCLRKMGVDAGQGYFFGAAQQIDIYLNAQDFTHVQRLPYSKSGAACA
ncbi:MAG: EAL domain-containing protein [Methyloligellaceae bacterium]